MAFCGKCGTQISEDTKFCPGCGAPNEASPAPAPAPAAVPADADRQAELTAKLAALNNTADTTDQFDRTDIEQNRAMAILAYFGPLVLVPILAAKNSKFARYHSNQGLILLALAVVYGIAYSILSSIIYAISWRLGFIVSIFGLFSIVIAVLAVIGIINALGGRAKELPVIGKFRFLK